MDENDCVFVIGGKSNKVFGISSDGQIGTEILNDLDKPYAIHFDKTSKLMVIANESGSIKVYKKSELDAEKKSFYNSYSLFSLCKNNNCYSWKLFPLFEHEILCFWLIRKCILVNKYLVKSTMILDLKQISLL